MAGKGVTENVASMSYDVGNAVGMEKCHWFVAIVNHNTEKASSKKLLTLGIEHYLPLQSELHIWKNGRKSNIERVVIPSMIFIHCTEHQRRDIVRLPFIKRFLVNKAGVHDCNGHSPLAIIPDDQIRLLKFMLGQSEVPVAFSDRFFKTGDKVQVIRGTLTGLEGEVLEMLPTKSEVIVLLNCIGCARIYIDTKNIQLINDNGFR